MAQHGSWFGALLSVALAYYILSHLATYRMSVVIHQLQQLSFFVTDERGLYEESVTGDQQFIQNDHPVGTIESGIYIDLMAPMWQ